MKARLYFVALLFFFSSVLLAQNEKRFILLTGDSVFKYDNQINRWSERPMEKGALLNESDSIKSVSGFKLSIHKDSWFSFGKKTFTYFRTNGARVSNLNEEIDAGVEYVPQNSSIMGLTPEGNSTTNAASAVDYSLLSHLLWLIEHPTQDASITIELEYNYNNNWVLYKHEESIPINSVCKLYVNNYSSEAYYCHFFIKDETSITPIYRKKDHSILINDYSCFEKQFRFEPPYGSQTFIVFYADNKMVTIGDGLIREFEKPNKYHAKYSSKYENTIKCSILHCYVN